MLQVYFHESTPFHSKFYSSRTYLPALFQAQAASASSSPVAGPTEKPPVVNFLREIIASVKARLAWSKLS